MLYLIDEFTIQVPLINSTQLTSESRAVDVIIVDARDQSEESILFGGSQSGEDDDVKVNTLLLLYFSTFSVHVMNKFTLID